MLLKLRQGVEEPEEMTRDTMRNHVSLCCSTYARVLLQLEAPEKTKKTYRQELQTSSGKVQAIVSSLSVS